MTNDPIRIVIADGQPLVRQRLCRFLASDPGLEVAGNAPDADCTFELVRQIKPDILLIDFDLAREQKLRALFSSANSSPLRIVVMVTTVQKAEMVEAFLLGAHGVVFETSSPSLLIESIRRVMAGQYWLEHERVGVLVKVLREALLSRVNELSPPKDYGLTRRELEIMKTIASGSSNKEVGVKFAISERTVKHHLTNIFGKIGVTNRLQLALFAVNNRLIIN
jgi:DNA-binding NarL/FixJ family response regulator